MLQAPHMPRARATGNSRTLNRGTPNQAHALQAQDLNAAILSTNTKDEPEKSYQPSTNQQIVSNYNPQQQHQSPPKAVDDTSQDFIPKAGSANGFRDFLSSQPSPKLDSNYSPPGSPTSQNGADMDTISGLLKQQTSLLQRQRQSRDCCEKPQLPPNSPYRIISQDMLNFGLILLGISVAFNVFQFLIYRQNLLVLWA